MGIQKIIFLLHKECGRVCQRVVTVIARMKVIYEDSISFKEKWNCDRMRVSPRNRKNTRGTDGLYDARKRTHSSWKRSSKKVGKGSA